MGYKSISQICDFIGYIFPNIFYLECKSDKGNTFPIKNLTQYNKLLSKVNIPGVRAGAVIWFIDHGRVLYVPISTITKLIEDNKKSVNINTIFTKGYKVYEIPSVKKRTFCDSDYSCLTTLKEGE